MARRKSKAVEIDSEGNFSESAIELPDPPESKSREDSSGEDLDSKPKKRSRSSSSKNSSGVVVTKDMADVFAKEAVRAYSLPYKAWARYSKDEDLELIEEEKEALQNAVSNYIQMRPDVVGEYMPEIMLVIALSAPLGVRLMAPKKTDLQKLAANSDNSPE